MGRALSKYVLPTPPTDRSKLAEAVEACLRLLDLAKADRPNAPAVAAVAASLPWRAVLKASDFTVHFSGGTGDYKTSGARLAYQHFASGVDRRDKLPASWASSLASLQRSAHDCKDSLLIIDELTGEHATMVATEFIQCQGNLKGRDRMSKDLRVAPSLDPRGSALSTGEADPTRQSALGRMLTVRFTPATIDFTTLKACQADAAAGLYCLAMAGFVRWLAKGRRLETAWREHAELADRIAEEVRQEIGGRLAHPRHSEVVGELVAGYQLFLRFATEQAGIGRETADAYAGSVQRHLTALLDDQREIQREANSAQRFLALLASGLASKRCHLVNIENDHAPANYADACGWYKHWLYQGNDMGQGLDWQIPADSKKVGYISLEEGFIFLDPEESRGLVKTMARVQGEAFENVAKIGRDLADAGLIRTEKDKDGKIRFTHQKRIKAAGKPRFFVLPITNLFGEDAEEECRRATTGPVECPHCPHSDFPSGDSTSCRKFPLLTYLLTLSPLSPLSHRNHEVHVA